MAFSHRVQTDTIIFQVSGSLDIYTSIDFRNHIESTVNDSFKTIVIDMQTLNYIDSSGIGMLIKVMNTYKASNYEFILTRLKPAMEKVFKVAGLSSYFDFMGEKDFAEKYSPSN
ncbi:MAG: STAS domain-containing protein [Leptospiraceae bacterium]|nr:STAS domain-containing protein [Leptospiraceae bacterium]